MIEREFVAQKTKEYYIMRYIKEKLQIAGISQIKLKKIPLGEKIIIDTSRPSLIVGSKGANIKDLTKVLKKKFKLENPQIEINEVKDIYLDANIVAERIANSLERFGSARFKGIGHKMMTQVMGSGALGVEIIISGKIPGARAKSWRFYMGYLKKCGDISVQGVRKAYSSALLKSGVIGIKVAIMPPDLELPDAIKIREEPQQAVSEKMVLKEIEVEGKKSPKKSKKKEAEELTPSSGEKAETAEKKKTPRKRKESAKKEEVKEAAGDAAIGESVSPELSGEEEE